MRIGAKGRPFYRVVVVDERSKRTGGYIENVGTYNPLTEPKDIKLNQDRIDYWIKQGAQLSDGFLRIIGKAKQRNPRKPRKAAPEPTQPAPAKSEPTPEEKPEEATMPEIPLTETPIETVQPEPTAEETPAEEK